MPIPSVIRRALQCPVCETAFVAFLHLVSQAGPATPTLCPKCGTRQDVKGSALAISYPLACQCGKNLSIELEPSGSTAEVRCPQCSRDYLLYGSFVTFADV